MEVKEIISIAGDKMKKSLSALDQKLSTLRTGQASSQQFEHIPVECYGSTQMLHQISNISVPEARQILIKAWDITLLPYIEKAIIKSDIAANPQNDGKVIRIHMPPLTDETRAQVIKQTKELSEEAKIGIRNIRRDANDKLKKLHTNNVISEDVLIDEEQVIQKLTDETIQNIQLTTEKKEHEIKDV